MMLWIVSAALLGQPAAPPLCAEVEAAALRATVRVYDAAKNAGGSAVAIGRLGPHAYLLTAAHVVAGATNVEIHIFTPGGGRKPAHVLSHVKVVATTNPLVQDLALLRVVADADRFKTLLPVRLAATLPRPPCRAFSVGSTDFDPPVVQPEKVVGVQRVRKAAADEAALFWKCDAMPVVGRSGGPLLSTDGALLGICSGGAGGACYYTHVDEIQRFLKHSGLRLSAD